jgi:hypothetical protein
MLQNSLADVTSFLYYLIYALAGCFSISSQTKQHTALVKHSTSVYENNLFVVAVLKYQWEFIFINSTVIIWLL